MASDSIGCRASEYFENNYGTPRQLQIASGNFISSMAVEQQVWLRLTSVQSATQPKNGWSVIQKDEGKLVYVPSPCVLHFTWSSISQVDLRTNYPDSFSNDLHTIKEFDVFLSLFLLSPFSPLLQLSV